MPYLVAAVVLVGLLCLVDLVLTFGVIRRLRQHAELLSRRMDRDERILLGAGERVADFAATTFEGEAVSRAGLGGDTLVGFFSPSCAACAERLPDFVDRAARHDGGRARVLAVVVGDASETATQRDLLTPVARVAVEPREGPLATAFAVQGFPAFALVDAAGSVLASGLTVEDLRATGERYDPARV